MAGKSDQEKAAEEFHNQSANREAALRNTIQSGQADAMAGIESNFTKSQEFLQKNTRNQVQGMGLQLGEALANQGIAPGADAGSAWVAQMSPIYAQGNANLANLFGSRMNLEAGMKQNFTSQLMNALMGNYQMTGQSISGMKDSTAFGDLMSVLLPAGQLGLAAFTGGSKIPTPTTAGGV